VLFATDKNIAHPPTSDLKEGIKTVGVRMDQNGSQRYNFFMVVSRDNRGIQTQAGSFLNVS